MPLEIENLRKTLGEHCALRDVSLNVLPGEIVALIGRNGAGKTTLLRCACGRLRPDAGEVRLYGAAPTRRAARRRLGFVPQALALYARLSVEENLEVFGRLLGVQRRDLADRVTYALNRAGLADRARQPVAALSGGMQRRLNVVASLLHRPSLVLLDEPTAGVDVQSLQGLEALLSELREEGTALLIASHDLALAERSADRVIVLHDGGVQAAGTPAELVASTFADRLHVTITLPWGAGEVAVEQLTRRGFAAADGGRLVGQCEPETLEEILSVLRGFGGRAQEVRVRDPGLADVFASLVGSDA